MARVEEARCPVLGRFLACEQRLRHLHLVAAALELGRYRLAVARRLRAVEALLRALVDLDCLVVMLLCLGVSVRHRAVDIERADLVAQFDQVVARDLLDRCELGTGAAATVECVGAQTRAREPDEDQRARATSAAARAAASASTTG